ncbi:unnamed protein product [Arabis nemorensis]|uniref:Replication factor A C-terminal domain-containing protein n=1 Tax=Arabis nemorensis TaxID=586526 RepID=A0A565B0D9_9BRAS|nr:unnamed protein product [Arabis nemorensis]
MTLKGIIKSKETGTCVKCSTIKSIDVAKNWYYVSCKCNNKVQEYGEDSNDLDAKYLYNCEICRYVEDVITKYYLVLRVSDESEAEAKFLFFNEVASKLLKKHSTKLTMEVLHFITQ